MSFSELILGFSSAALSYMGYQAHESVPKMEKNLSLARQNIGIIELLRDKTKGNLTPEEQKLTEHVLGDLQLRYVEATKSK